MWNTHDLKTTFKLTKLFRELNGKYFSNMLGDCTFEAVPYPFHTAACIRSRRKWTGGYTANIKFNSNIHWNAENIRQVLLHEMIHYYINVRLNRNAFFSHGIRFLLVMLRINLCHNEHIHVYWHGEKIPVPVDGRKK